ncbi:sensitivity to red-light reduced protein [Mortierella alpina]|uniref:Sensitivity to red-light reduced protein n=1 Tax=Mortierella alpina TaxID=64518 RepID=A0A9P6J491_MORAP|nr:sensitivity to red-light reduced protein [Mortierella alpina]
MASFQESAGAAGSCLAEMPAEEPFTFVCRKKKNGPRRATTTPPAPLIHPRNAEQESPEHNLPGWSTRRSAKVKKNSQRARMMGSRGPEHGLRTLEWGQSMMEDRVVSLKQSRFYEAFRELVMTALCPLCESLATEANKEHVPQQRRRLSQAKVPTESKSGNQEETTETLSETKTSSSVTATGQPGRHAFVDMVCYGIGSIESSRNSQFQLGLALCLKDILKIRGTISIFDPAMTEYDQRLVEKLGMSVLKVNDQAKQVVEVRTLLYMPHCPKGLYSHVLETNWTREQLDRLVILGNRFTMYDERQFENQAPFILPALSIADVHTLPAIKFEDNTIFNDLAIHSFPSHNTVPKVDVRGREQDPEMI